MKLLFSIIAVFTMVLTNVNAANFDGDKHRDPSVTVQFIGEIGIPRKECRGIGTGCLKGVVINIEIGFNNRQVLNPNTVVFSKTNDNFITLLFVTKDNNPSLEFEVDTDFKLDPKVANAFQKNSITLLKGVYKASKAEDGQYSVTVPISQK